MSNNDNFNGQILSEKLSKLNSSQQSIESLSRWCISHRKKAKLIVETWDKLFNSSQREQRVSFLYLANDILQNSRRKGSEFVNEFWKVLPAALKHVHDNGDENGKKVAFRLIDIWEERKVFGSRGQSLKDEIQGKDPPSLSVSNGKTSNPIKIVKRDAHSVRIKLAVGGMPEKLLTAFQAVEEEHLKEDAALNNCKAAVHYVTRFEDDIEKTITQGDHQGSALVDELRKQESILQQCVGEFESAEATRAALASRLREALQDQESELELVRTQLQVARSVIEQARNMRKRLTSPVPGHTITTTNLLTEAMRVVEPNVSPAQPTSTPPQPSLSQPMMSFAPVKGTEEKMRAAAAAVAAKLTASTSSAQMLTSILSSLVAEEAAAMNGGSKSAGFASDLSMFSPAKRQKLEKPLSVSDVSNTDVSATAYVSPLQQQTVTSVPPAPSTSMQPLSQVNQFQATFPPPPPPPPASPANPPANQFGQTAGLMVGVMPYGYTANTLPPPPPLPPHVAMGLARPAPLPPQQSQQQPSSTGGYYRPPGIGFYGQNHQPSPPPVPRQ